VFQNLLWCRDNCLNHWLHWLKWLTLICRDTACRVRRRPRNKCGETKSKRGETESKHGETEKIISITNCINPKLSNNTSLEFQIEGDWSAAATLLSLGVIGGNVTLANINSNSPQPDAIILKLFEELNINCAEIASNIFRASKSNYNGFEIDATNCPDLIPILVVLGFKANSTSKIKGINRLTNKECNRKDTLAKVFKLLGGKINIINNNEFEVKSSKLTGGFIDSHNDHRIAMAIAVAAQLCTQPITLTRAECVAKSFNDFWKYF